MAERTDNSRARLAAELTRRSGLETAIAACAQRFAETHEVYEILRSAVTIIRDHIGVDRVGIFLHDEQNNRFTGAFGTDESGGLRDERWHVITEDPRTPIQRALRGEGDEFFVENFHQEFPDDPFMRGVTNNFFVVMRAHGRLLGGISCDNLLTQRPIDEAMREQVRRFTRYIALALENHQLLERLEEKNRALEEELTKSRRLVQELDRVNDELKDFAYIVSHDLKAPLRGISSLAQWLQEDYAASLDEEGKAKLTLMISRCRRMHDLIEGILRYSRVGTMKVQMSRLDSAAVVAGVIDALSPPAHIKITICDSLPEVVFDRTQLEQVFQNLIGNAIVHLGKPRGEIRVEARDAGDAWMFCIRDDGVGIDPKHFDRIFKIFQTLNTGERKAESTGIGLSVVKKIVESHGGTIRVESEVGKGSAFYFAIPKVGRSVETPGSPGGQA